MLLFRVDNRLVHGQIIEAWLPFTGAEHLIVANDALAADILRQHIISMAVPQHVCIHFSSIAELPSLLALYKNQSILVLLENCHDMARAMECKLSDDLPTLQLNVGNLHFGPQKQQLLPHVAVTDDELTLLKTLAKKHALNFCAVPSERPLTLHELCC